MLIEGAMSREENTLILWQRVAKEKFNAFMSSALVTTRLFLNKESSESIN